MVLHMQQIADKIVVHWFSVRRSSSIWLATWEMLKLCTESMYLGTPWYFQDTKSGMKWNDRKTGIKLCDRHVLEWRKHIYIEYFYYLISFQAMSLIGSIYIFIYAVLYTIGIEAGAIWKKKHIHKYFWRSSFQRTARSINHEAIAMDPDDAVLDEGTSPKTNN